jgi:putative membrane protein
MGDRVALSIIGVLSFAIVAVVGLLMLVHESGRPWSAEVAALPALNASLNGTSAALLAVGWAAIRRRRIALHRACMLGACIVSTLFLMSYVTYHYLAGSRPFAGQGWIRSVYFPILISHIALAAAMVPFVLTTVYRALAGDFVRHVRIARVTLPVWLYVSVTGVLVYLLLYHLS